MPASKLKENKRYQNKVLLSSLENIKQQVGSLQDKVGAFSGKEKTQREVSELCDLSGEFEDILGSFEKNQGYKSYFWTVLLDLGKVIQTVHQCRRKEKLKKTGGASSADSDSNPYWLVERLCVSEEESAVHKLAKEIQSTLNRTSQDLTALRKEAYEKQRDDAWESRLKEKSYEIKFSLTKAIIGISNAAFAFFFIRAKGIPFLFRGLCSIFLSVISGVVRGRVLEQIIMSMKRVLKFYFFSGRDKKREKGVANEERAFYFFVKILCYWGFLWATSSRSLALLFIGTALAFSVSTSSLALAVSAVLYGISELVSAYSGYFPDLVGEMLQDVSACVVTFTMFAKVFSFFFQERAYDMDWQDVKRMINPRRVNWWRFVRGFTLTFLSFLIPMLPFILSQSTTVIFAHWLIAAGISVCFLLIQTLTEEIMFRSPVLLETGSWVKAALNILLSGLVFGFVHIGNPEFSVLSGGWYSFIAFLLDYVFAGLSWAIATYFSGGVEMAWGMHFANNLFLSVIMGYTPSPLTSLPLFSIELESESMPGACIKTPGSMLGLFIHMVVAEASWLGTIYFMESMFRPKYYVRPLDDYPLVSDLVGKQCSNRKNDEGYSEGYDILNANNDLGAIGCGLR